jgi:hypothetical protein
VGGNSSSNRSARRRYLAREEAASAGGANLVNVIFVPTAGGRDRHIAKDGGRLGTKQLRPVNQHNERNVPVGAGMAKAEGMTRGLPSTD